MNLRVGGPGGRVWPAAVGLAVRVVTSLLRTRKVRENDGHGAIRKAAESLRLVALAARLVWRASPRIAVGIALLFGLQAALSPLELFVTRAVLDSAALTWASRARARTP
jgi:hypothetical protein